MNAKDKYKLVFGEIKTLADELPWTAGVSNMMEWLAWAPHHVLGTTKADYIGKIVKFSHEAASRGDGVKETLKYVISKVDEEKKASEKDSKFDGRPDVATGAREALRRARFLDESYLNKEFDIFRHLVSDRYLDKYYGQFTKIRGDGQWSSHGNSGLFECSTRITRMQMDNLSYNKKEGLLVSNELKLGGKKNKDQILKHAFMFNELKRIGFVGKNDRFLLLFIGGNWESKKWDELIDQEINACKKDGKSKSIFIEDENINIARTCEHAHTSWEDMVAFNNNYMSRPPKRDVESKLLCGFNRTHGEKKPAKSNKS